MIHKAERNNFSVYNLHISPMIFRQAFTLFRVVIKNLEMVVMKTIENITITAK